MHLVSSFAFEGMLKFCGSLLHGTRGFGSQLGHHLAAENYLNFQAESEISKMENLRLKSFCDQKTRSLKNGLIGKITEVLLRYIKTIIRTIIRTKAIILVYSQMLW